MLIFRYFILFCHKNTMKAHNKKLFYNNYKNYIYIKSINFQVLCCCTKKLVKTAKSNKKIPTYHIVAGD